MRALIPLVLILSCAFAVKADDTVGATRNAFVATQDPLGESVTKVVYLDQNWSPDESTRFYFTPQGSQIDSLRLVPRTRAGRFDNAIPRQSEHPQVPLSCRRTQAR